MLRLQILTAAIFSAALLGGNLSSRAESPAEAPDFREVYDTIQSHLAGTSQAELNRVAVQALVTALKPKVALVGASGGQAPSSESLTTVAKTSLFDGPVGYVRVGKVDSALPKAIRDAYTHLGVTNKLCGLVLDLRYAEGDDYDAAAKAANLFIKKEQPLLDWGQGIVRSTENNEAIALPLAVLINARSGGGAEALSAALRHAGVALLLGGRTSGQAMVAEEYPLKNGTSLRIASSPVRLGDGTDLSQGVKPDIAVDVNPQDERVYFADAFKDVSRTNLVVNTGLSATNQVNGTNRTRRVRFNEAELVREKRDGFDPDTESSPAGSTEPEKPVVRDPALARALDVLKGLAVIRHSRS